MKPYYDRDGITIYHGDDFVVDCGHEEQAWTEAWIQAVSRARCQETRGATRREAPRMEGRRRFHARRQDSRATHVPGDRGLHEVRFCASGATPSRREHSEQFQAQRRPALPQVPHGRGWSS